MLLKITQIKEGRRRDKGRGVEGKVDRFSGLAGADITLIRCVDVRMEVEDGCET